MHRGRAITVAELSDEQLLSVIEDIRMREKYGSETFRPELLLAISAEMKKRKLKIPSGEDE